MEEGCVAREILYYKTTLEVEALEGKQANFDNVNNEVEPRYAFLPAAILAKMGITEREYKQIKEILSNNPQAFCFPGLYIFNSGETG